MTLRIPKSLLPLLVSIVLLTFFSQFSLFQAVRAERERMLIDFVARNWINFCANQFTSVDGFISFPFSGLEVFRADNTPIFSYGINTEKLLSRSKYSYVLSDKVCKSDPSLLDIEMLSFGGGRIIGYVNVIWSNESIVFYSICLAMLGFFVAIPFVWSCREFKTMRTAIEDGENAMDSALAQLQNQHATELMRIAKTEGKVFSTVDNYLNLVACFIGRLSNVSGSANHNAERMMLINHEAWTELKAPTERVKKSIQGLMAMPSPHSHAPAVLFCPVSIVRYELDRLNTPSVAANLDDMKLVQVKADKAAFSQTIAAVLKYIAHLAPYEIFSHVHESSLGVEFTLHIATKTYSEGVERLSRLMLTGNESGDSLSAEEILLAKLLVSWHANFHAVNYTNGMNINIAILFSAADRSEKPRIALIEADSPSLIDRLEPALRGFYDISLFDMRNFSEIPKGFDRYILNLHAPLEGCLNAAQFLSAKVVSPSCIIGMHTGSLEKAFSDSLRARQVRTIHIDNDDIDTAELIGFIEESKVEVKEESAKVINLFERVKD